MSGLSEKLDKLNKAKQGDIADLVWELAEVDDGRVPRAFVSILRDAGRHPGDKIDILKELPFMEACKAGRTHTLVGKAVLALAKSDDDPLVQEYATDCLWGFVDVKGAIRVLEALAADTGGNPNVRSNALAALHHADSPECQEALARLATLPSDHGRYAKEHLRQIRVEVARKKREKERKSKQVAKKKTTKGTTKKKTRREKPRKKRRGQKNATKKKTVKKGTS